jgi:hypothetical protein
MVGWKAVAAPLFEEKVGDQPAFHTHHYGAEMLAEKTVR